MKKKVSFIVCLILINLSLFSGCSFQERFSDSFVVFGTEITFSYEAVGNKKEVNAAIEEIRAKIKTIDDELSLNKESVLKYFNEKAAINEWVEVSKTSYDILEKSIDLFNKTNGAFNIAVLPLVKLWNVDAGNKLLTSDVLQKADEVLPSIEKVNEAIQNCDLTRLKLKKDGEKYYISKTGFLTLDTGGIAKGYAADIANETAKAFGIKSFLTDISGNIYLTGRFYENLTTPTNWTIGVTDPRDKGKFFKDVVCALDVAGDISIVTSGDYQRFYTVSYDGVNSFSIPHIINPISGLPIGVGYNAETNSYFGTGTQITSVTILNQSSAVADGLSTACAVLGLEKSIELLKTLNASAAIFTADNKFFLSEGVTLFNEDKYNKFKEFAKV